MPALTNNAYNAEIESWADTFVPDTTATRLVAVQNAWTLADGIKANVWVARARARGSVASAEEIVRVESWHEFLMANDWKNDGVALTMDECIVLGHDIIGAVDFIGPRRSWYHDACEERGIPIPSMAEIDAIEAGTMPDPVWEYDRVKIYGEAARGW